MGDYERDPLGFPESSLRYHPSLCVHLTPYWGTVLGGEFNWGGCLLKNNGGAQRYASPGWKSGWSCIRISMLNWETNKSIRYESRWKWSGTNMWEWCRSTDKSYSRDNRLIPSKSSHRRRSLAPRCRLVASWGWRSSQGYGCSPFKAVRELGSERRETVWPLSAVSV